jgi:hypothetical protein
MNQRTRISLFLSITCCIALTLVFALPSHAQQVPTNTESNNDSSVTSGSSSSGNDAELTQQRDVSKHPIDPQDEAIEQNLNPQTTTPHSAGQASSGGSRSGDSLSNRDAGRLSQRGGLHSEAVRSQYASELPRTAGELRLLALMGCMSLIGAAASRIVRATSRS